MDLKSLKIELKALIAKFSAQKFAEAKTADGKVMSCEGEAMAVGAACTIDGQPAPDGEYKMEDGSTCTVKEGKIIDMKPKAEEAAKPDDMNEVAQMIEKIVNEKMSAMAADFGKQIADMKTAFESKFAEKETANTTAMAEVKESFEKEVKFRNEVLTLLEKIPDGEVEVPAGKKHKTPVDPIADFKKKYMKQ